MAIIKSVTDEDAGAVTRRRTAALFHCLADPMRLMILEHLKTGEHKVKELTEHLGLAQSTVSAHLACLREGNLVKARSVGRSSLYSLNDEARLQTLLKHAGPLVRAQQGEHHWLDEHEGPNSTQEALHSVP